jgi:hypothetical protein
LFSTSIKHNEIGTMIGGACQLQQPRGCDSGDRQVYAPEDQLEPTMSRLPKYPVTTTESGARRRKTALEFKNIEKIADDRQKNM